jgi:pilus assembly protein CpaB
MKLRGVLLLLLSLVSGVVAVVWLHNLNQAAVSPETASGTSIVVARKNLEFGDHIASGDLQLIKWPSDSMPAGAYGKIEDVAGPGQDRVVLRPMEANEPVLGTKISGNGGKSSLSAIIGSDKRAVTIHVNDATGVAGFVQPGDHVDVLLTHASGAGPAMNSPMSASIDVLLQDVLVRAIDQESNVRKDTATVVKAVTVEVSPSDAQKLTLASSIGTLSLTLRNMQSKQDVAPRSLSVSDLLPRVAAPAPVVEKVEPPPAPARPSYDIVRGTAATNYEVKPDKIGAASAEASRAPRSSRVGAD